MAPECWKVWKVKWFDWSPIFTFIFAKKLRIFVSVTRGGLYSLSNFFSVLTGHKGGLLRCGRVTTWTLSLVYIVFDHFNMTAIPSQWNSISSRVICLVDSKFPLHEGPGSK